MNGRRLFALFLLFSLASSMAWGQLSGTKTIGGTSPDYASFADAVSALHTQGVSGPVLFQVRPGSYNERIKINRIRGASATNTVTFEGVSAEQCSLWFASTSYDTNYVVWFDTTSYVAMHNLTIRAAGTQYARVIDMSNYVRNITFRENVFQGTPNANGASTQHAILYTHDQGTDSITIAGNTFRDGGYAVYIGGTNSDHTARDSIYGNTFFMNRYVAVGLAAGLSAYIADNVVDSTTGYGVHGSYFGRTEILRNRINSSNEAIDVNCTGYQLARTIIANNAVTARTHGIFLNGSDYVDVLYNSVRITGWNYIENSAFVAQNSNHLRVLNNIFAAEDHGLALHVGPVPTYIECDYNDLSTPDVYIAYWGSPRYDLQELQDSTGTNMYSVSVVPYFQAWRDLTPRSAWVNGKGTPLTEVTTDITGALRDPAQPDLGAAEFVPGAEAVPPLAGTYSVGSGGDFADFPSAANALMLRGVSGQVTCNILPGSLTCHVEFLAIPGSTPTRSVTFQSASEDTGDTELTYGAAGDADNYIVRFKGADHLRFRNLTFRALGPLYAHTVEMTGGVDDLAFEGNLFRGLYWTDAQYRAALFVSDEWKGRRFAMTRNTFRTGGQGLYLDNVTHSTLSVAVTNNRFENIGYRAAWIRGADWLEFTNNVIAPGASSGVGIQQISTRTVVRNNIIHSRLVGLAMNGVAASASAPSLIANNFITVSNSAGNDSYGVTMSLVTNARLYHNSVSVSGFYPGTPVVSIQNSSAGIQLINNCFAHLGYGMAFEIPYSFGNDPVDVSHHNNWYTAWNFLGYYRTSYIRDLEQFQSATGRETGSLSAYPHFLSPADLHTVAPWLDGKGIRLDSVLTDIDGEARPGPTTADIGADEFSSDPALTPWSGIMTVGPAGDIPDLATAAREGSLRGISASLTLRMLDGTHQGRVTFLPIPGASAASPVVIESQSGTPAVITYAATADSDNYVLQLFGADHFRIRNLSLASGGSTYARVLWVRAGVEDLEVTGNTLTGKAGASVYKRQAVLQADSSFYTRRIITGNTVRDGSYGLYLRGIDAYGYQRSQGLLVAENTVRGSNMYGLTVGNNRAPFVERNTIDSCKAGIDVNTCDSLVRVLENRVYTLGDKGLYLYDCDGTSAVPALAANNFLIVGGSSDAHGVSVGGCDTIDVVHNSVSVTSTHTTYGRAFYEAGNSKRVRLVNNIFANTGGGYAYYASTAANITTSDYNDLYATGTNLAYWTTNQTSLANLQSASGMDLHSLSADPVFASAQDLHTLNPVLNGKGTPVATVQNDIDLQRRNPIAPDIGADEYRIGPSTAPQLASPIADVTYPEDSGQHLVADLRTVIIDTDPDDALAFTADITPGKITLILRNDSLFVDCPPNQIGTSTVTVLATDLDGLTAADTFTVTYTPVNDPPLARDDSATTTINTAVTITVVRNDFDVDGHLVFIETVGPVAHGNIAIDPGDTLLSYTPEIGYAGADSCFYVATDRSGGLDTAMVRISVLSVFSLVPTTFDSLSHCSAAWGDYDGDGDMDLAITGLRTEPNLRYSTIYRCVPGGYNVYPLTPGLQPNKDQGLQWIDLEGDGDLDLIACGIQHQGTANRIVLYENRSGSMTQLTTDLPGIWAGALAWADYDNDGDPDLLLTGSTDVGIHIGRVFRNDGPGTSNNWIFTNSGAGLPSIWQSSAAWGDFDNDGDPDVAITGVNATGDMHSQIYRNDAGTFIGIGAPLVPVFNGSLDWMDYDSDGDLDLLITGDKGLFDPVALLYRNDNGTFTLVPTSIRGVGSSSVAWGDYDGDGDPDVLIAGRDTTGAYITRLYSNDSGQFGALYHTFPGVTWGTVALVDIDNDGDLDVFIAGYTEDARRIVTLYRNNLPATNSPPEPPPSWSTSDTGTDWVFHWLAGSDEQTPAAGLTYAFRLGTEPGLSDVVAPMSLSNGRRMVPAMGMQNDTLRIVKGLRRGKLYHWAVQSIDPTYAASPFSTGWYFSVYHPAFTEHYSGLPNRMASACAFGDYTRDGKLDVALAGSWPTLGAGNAGLYFRSADVFKPTTTPLPQVAMPALAWGDYDNDGDLDLAIAGSPGSGSLTRIYRHDAAEFVDLGAGLAGTHEGALAWGDYDNDGDLDLLITGNWTTKLYRNTGGTFTDAGAAFVQLLKSSAEWGDYDRDGDLDLLVTGQSPTAGTPVMNSKVYRNDNGTFTDINAGLKGVKSGTGIWGDYDNDGDLDILIAGDMGTSSPNVPFTGLYRNNGGTFTFVQTPFDSVHHASAAWADYDNDGLLDLVLCGDTLWWDQGGAITRIFRNTGSLFTSIDHPVIPMSGGKVAWGSLYGPGRLDLLVTGSGWTKLYWNRSLTSNTPPGVPANLQAIFRDSLVVLRWSRPADTETPRAALTYNVRVGTTRGGSQIMSAMSDSTGLRLIPARGNAGADSVYCLKGLVRGRRYYWTVQAVDNGYRGSPFATEVSFIYGLSVWNPRRWGLAKPIPDLQLTTDTLVMSSSIVIGASPLQKAASNRTVTDVTVVIDSVYHAADGDLEFTLTHAGVTDTLISRTGGSGDNFLGTILSDSAATPIASGAAPFAGEFTPFSPLAKFRGTDPEGEWILSIRDGAAGNTGLLQGWGLDIFYDRPVGVDGEQTIPDQFIVFQNFPNPFNPSTEIRFGLPQGEQVTVTIYNLLGQKVAEPVSEHLPAGYHSIAFDGKNLASGVYVYRVRAGENVGARKMLLLK